MDKMPQTFAGLLSGSTIKLVEFKLPDDIRSGISKALGKPVDDPSTLKFLEMLEAELGRYAVLEAQRQQQATLKQKAEALNKFSASTSQMMDQFSKSDDLSYRTLEQLFRSAKGMDGMLIDEPTSDEALPNATLPKPLGEFEKDLRTLLMLVDGLQANYESKIKPGAPAKISRQDLIDSIICIYQGCFASLPVSTVSKNRKGFEPALRLCLECVQIVIADLHSEIKESLLRVRGK